MWRSTDAVLPEKSTLAKDLQKQLDCNVIHMDDFYLQPHQRTTKRLREPGGNVDYERFETEVLQPMLTGEAFSYRPYDAHAVCFLPEVIVSPKKVTIIEGSYACHPRLRRSYDLRIFLTVDRQEQLERIRKRNGEEREEMFERIWIPLEERYFWKAGVEKDLRYQSGYDRAVRGLSAARVWMLRNEEFER